MQKASIQVPEKGTYQGQLFDYWSDEFHQTHAEHSAYIALNFAGVLDACRLKWQNLLHGHEQQAIGTHNGSLHQRAIQRLQSTMTGAAIAYESGFKTCG